jgi:hypothetical protein
VRLASLFARFRNVLRSRRISEEIDRELAFHLAERVDDLVAAGMSPDRAEHEARRRFGSYALQAEDTRDRDVIVWLETLVADVRYAWRALRAHPAFSSVAVLSLALGIGANTAIFTLVNTVMIKTLPVRDPDALVWISSSGQGGATTDDVWRQIRDRQDLVPGPASSPTRRLARN